MIRDALLAVGLLLSTAHQLRVPGIPIGPGELCLAIWVVLALFHEASSVSSILGRISRPPSVQLVTYSESDAGCAPNVDRVFAALLALARRPEYAPDEVDLRAAGDVSARVVAGTLARVLDQICVVH